MMRLLKKRESGQAMIMVLGLLAIGGVLIVPMLKLGSSSLEYHMMAESKTLEGYAADAGMEYALCKLGNNPGAFEPETLPSEVNGRIVTVTVEEIGSNVYRITSTAISDSGSSTTITSHVCIAVSFFDYGMAAIDGDITMSGNAEVSSSPDLFEGDIYANGQIYLSGNAEVQGDVTATGTVDISGNASVEGGIITEETEPVVFADIDTAMYLYQANLGTLIEGDLHINDDGYYDLGPAHITGNLNISGNAVVRLGGTVWVDGTISMSGNTRIEGPYSVVAVGDISLTGNSILDPGDIPLIISTDGNMTISGNNWTSAILYAPNGSIEMAGNSKIYGSVAAQSINTSGNNQVEYCVALRERGDLPARSGPMVYSRQTSN